MALGPAIKGEVYQVHVGVAAEVGASVFDPQKFKSHDAFVDFLQTLERPPILKDAEFDKVRLDVRRINELQLVQLGLSPKQIAIAEVIRSSRKLVVVSEDSKAKHCNSKDRLKDSLRFWHSAFNWGKFNSAPANAKAV